VGPPPETSAWVRRGEDQQVVPLSGKKFKPLTRPECRGTIQLRKDLALVRIGRDVRINARIMGYRLPQYRLSEGFKVVFGCDKGGMSTLLRSYAC
jgi:hypothetical protein